MTRLAPSPTGALHLGNARTFLINWALARAEGWRVLLRIEDLDTPRTKAGAAAEAIETLVWLGMDWDEGPVFQLDDATPYEEAMERLSAAGAVYPLAMSRAELDAAAAELAASAPQAGVAGESRCPPSLRPAVKPASFRHARRGHAETNWRFVCPGGGVTVRDRFAGVCSFDPSASVGDFVLWTKRDQPSYQLAVVVDDARQGVTHVVRGDDLLESAARQRLLYDALGERGPTDWYHVPLVVGRDGRRLAKRHGDTRLTTMRAGGVPAEAVVGLIAAMSGVVERPERMPAVAFAERFDLARLPREAVVFTDEHERWLMEQAR